MQWEVGGKAKRVLFSYCCADSARFCPDRQDYIQNRFGWATNRCRGGLSCMVAPPSPNRTDLTENPYTENAPHTSSAASEDIKDPSRISHVSQMQASSTGLSVLFSSKLAFKYLFHNHNNKIALSSPTGRPSQHRVRISNVVVITPLLTGHGAPMNRHTMHFPVNLSIRF